MAVGLGPRSFLSRMSCLTFSVRALARGLGVVFSCSAVSAAAQAPAAVSTGSAAQDGSAQPGASGSLFPSASPASESPLHSVPPSSLLDMRLHPAALPLEAELSCSVQFGCQMGLTRGFSVGGDLLNTAGMTMLGQHFFGAGAWTFLDANVGFQFLRKAERNATFMGSMGFRSYGYKNSESAKLSRSGLAFRTAYAEAVFPAYTQGLVFDAFSAPVVTAGGAHQPFTKSDDKKVRNLVREFALFTRLNPLLRLQLPADLEIINWKPSQVDLPAPVRGYFRINPTYEQADLSIQDAGESIYRWTEKRFGLQLMLSGAYASPEQKSGRLGLLGGLGFEMAATDSKVESKSPSQDFNPLIPQAPLIRGKLEVQATYQF